MAANPSTLLNRSEKPAGKSHINLTPTFSDDSSCVLSLKIYKHLSADRSQLLEKLIIHCLKQIIAQSIIHC